MSKKKQDSREPWSQTAPSKNGMAHRDQLISSSTAHPKSYTSHYHQDSAHLSKPLIPSISPNNVQHQSWNNNLLAQSQQGDVHHYPAAMVMNNQQYQWGPYNNDQNQMLTGYYQYFLSNTLNQQATLYAQQSQQSTFYTTTADTIASSPLWEQLRLPTTWMTDAVFENHIKGLQSIFLYLMESNKAHLPVETLAYYATQFGAWIQYIFLNRQEISSGQQCDLQNIDHSAQSQDQLQQLPVADSNVAQTGDSYTGSKETHGSVGDVENTDSQPVTSSGDGVTSSKDSDSSAANPHHSRLGNWKPWVTGTALRSNQGNGTNMRPLQSVSAGPLPHRWTPPPGTGLLGSAPGFTQSGQVAGRPPYFPEYRQQGLPPGPVPFPSFPRGGQPIRLLGPGPMASEAPPVYVDAFNPYFMAQPPPQFQGDHPSMGPNLIGQSILPYLSNQKPSVYYGGSPMYSMAHPPPQPPPPQSCSPFPQPPPTGDGSAVAHQYILEKLRCTCKD